MTHNEPERVMELVHKIGDNARETITNLSDIVWSINPANDKGEVVFSRMESFASFLLSSKNIQLNFNCDEALRKMEFSMETRQHLFLIFKEAINNAAKYSNAKQVNVAVSLWNGKIKMSIADNGVGFTVPKWSENGKSNGSIHNGGNGLSNIRLRTDQLKGNLDIRSSAEGTTLELVLPLT
ncbi:MAG: ATP-binding protein [Bacteroidetes bacterium]|nr:ATP-binding protein [Bacteroidota bacterium]